VFIFLRFGCSFFYVCRRPVTASPSPFIRLESLRDFHPRAPHCDVGAILMTKEEIARTRGRDASSKDRARRYGRVRWTLTWYPYMTDFVLAPLYEK
jgi:hypothetical protein